MTLEIEDDFNRVTKVMMNEMNEKLWLTSLKEIELKEFKPDRYYRYQTLTKSKSPKGNNSLIYSDHFTFLWEKNSIIYMIKLENPLKNEKNFFEKFSDFTLNDDFFEFYTFERLSSEGFRKEGTRVNALVVFPNEEENDLCDAFYQYSMQKLSDFSGLQKNSGLIFIESHNCTTQIEEELPFLTKELQELLKQEMEDLKNKRLLMTGDMSDRKSQLTENQLEIFLDFKEKINSLIDEDLAKQLTDNIYCRYLQGYVWELKVAEEKMLGMLKWAKENDLYKQKLENFQDYVDKQMCYKLCEDRDGRPVFYFIIRRFIPSELDPDKLALFNGVLVDHFLKMGPQKTDNYVVIYEYKGVNIRKNIDLKLFGKLTPVLGSYFPETLYRLYSINMGLAFRGIFQAAKVFIHPRTMVKIRIVGGGDAIVNALKEDIDVDQIPGFLGGNDFSKKEPL